MKRKRIAFLGVGMLEAALTICWLASIEADTKNARLWGFSTSRLLMLAAMAALFLLMAALLIRQLGVSRKRMRSAEKRLSPEKRTAIARGSLFLFFAISIGYWVLGFVLPDALPAIFTRLKPLLILLMLLTMQTAIFFFHQPAEGGADDQGTRLRLGSVWSALLIFLLLQIGCFLLFRRTGLGLTPDPFDWQPTGMAVQAWQAAGSFLIAAFISWVMLLLRRGRTAGKGGTIFLFLFVWAVAALVWMSIPTEKVLRNSYFMEITPPNNLPYPASDAAYFGMWSESILAGYGLKDAVISRQFFVLILAGIQVLAGDNFLRAIDLLTILLALIPAFLFLLGKKLHSNGAGLMAAGFAIFREVNTLWLAPFFGVSDAKMFLSDLPMLLMFLMLLVACVNWLEDPESKKKLVLAGGLLGLSALIRSQILILLPLLWIFILCQKKLPRGARWRAAGIFTLAAGLVILPAMVRSIAISGTPMLEDSGIHGYELARRYAGDPNWQPDPGGEFDAREEILAAIGDHPGNVLHFIANHFSKDLIDSWQVLPVGLPVGQNANSLTDPAYQDAPERLLQSSVWSRLLTALFIAVGLAVSWARHRGAGLLPLCAGLVYMLASALGRYSGWRFILPADWVIYFYFCISIFACVEGLIRRVHAVPIAEASASETGTMVRQKKSLAPSMGILAALVFLGALPALSGWLIPEQVKPQPAETLVERLSALNDARLDPLLEQVRNGQLQILNGRILYPRWFAANEGLTSANPWQEYTVRDFDRLGFILLNQTNASVVMPMETVPAFLPHRADCIVIGKWQLAGWFNAAALILMDGNGNVDRVLTGE